jgi:hypothetical protein
MRNSSYKIMEGLSELRPERVALYESTGPQARFSRGEDCCIAWQFDL